MLHAIIYHGNSRPLQLHERCQQSVNIKTSRRKLTHWGFPPCSQPALVSDLASDPASGSPSSRLEHSTLLLLSERCNRSPSQTKRHVNSGLDEGSDSPAAQLIPGLVVCQLCAGSCLSSRRAQQEGQQKNNPLIWCRSRYN